MLIERDVPLQNLLQSAQRVAAGSGEFVLVLGEAGIGKTALLAEFASRLRANYLVLRGASEALFTARPLGPLRDMANELGAELVELLEEARDAARLFPKVLECLKLARRPTVLVFEDLHWADEASLDLLKYLGRRLEGVPALLVASVRTDELSADHAIWQLIGDLPAPRLQRIHLQPLSQPAVETMARAAGQQVQDLHRITGGNPFFVTELLGAQVHSAGELPASVREAVWARLARLGIREQQFLETVSLIPAAMESWLLEALEPGGIATSLDTCLGRGILVQDGEGNIQFRHELARHAVAERLAPSRRRALHALIGSALQVCVHAGRKVDLMRRVHHAAEAEDTAMLLDLAPRAAQQAARLGAHKQAAKLLAKMLKFVDRMAPELAAQLYEDWAHEAGLYDIDDAVIAARQKAVELWRKLGRGDKVGVNLRWLSRLHWYRGESAQADRYGIEAVRVLEKLPVSTGLAMAYSLRSQYYLSQDQPDKAISWGRRALEMADRLEDVESRVYALNNIGTSMLFSGVEEGASLLEECLALALRCGLDEHVASVYTNYSEYAVVFKKFELADRLLEEGIAFDEAHDLDAWTYYLAGWNAQLRLDQGRYGEAEAIARRVLERERQTLVMRLPALTVLGRVHSRMGETDALTYLQQALEGGNATREVQRIVPVRLALVEMSWLNLDEAACREWLQPLAEYDLSGMNIWHTGEIALWCHRLGISCPSSMAGKEQPAPIVAELAGDCRLAADAWLQLGLPFEAAMALWHDAGESAADSCVEAAILFEGVAAHNGAERARRRATDLGAAHLLPRRKRGPYATARRHPLGLTQREELVLGLLTKGLSNAEIAKRLNRSARTVEHHVSTLLSKTGANSRYDLIRKINQKPDMAAPASGEV